MSDILKVYMKPYISSGEGIFRKMLNRKRKPIRRKHMKAGWHRRSRAE